MTFALALLLLAIPAYATTVRDLRVTILSTNLADEGIGEWGFAALIEADGRRFLFDTGAHPATVLENAREMEVELASIEDLVLSHNHSDHTGGLVMLRRELMKANPGALRRVHVAAGALAPRHTAAGKPTSGILPYRAEYESTGGAFVVHDTAFELAPGIWLTGPIPRVHPEESFKGAGVVELAGGPKPDDVPEDSAVVIETPKGLVIVSGCGHAGFINTIDHAKAITKTASVAALIGGFHSFAFDDAQLKWTARRLRAAGVRELLGAHCTGIESLHKLRDLAKLDRRSAVVAAVGSSYSLDRGIDPGTIAK